MTKRKVNLKLIIESCNMYHENGIPDLVLYEELINVDLNESFIHFIEKIIPKYIINSKENIKNPYYHISNLNEILWEEYFNIDFVEKYLDCNYVFDYSFLDIPIKKLDNQFHILNKEIHLTICGAGYGGMVGRHKGVKIYFHTNEKDIHHKPHIHCKYGDEEFRIDLENLKPMDSTFKSKNKTNIALKLVAKNQKDLLNYWNAVVVKGESLKFEIKYL